jgi:arginase
LCGWPFDHIALFYYICRTPSLGGFVKNVKIISIESDFGAGKKGAKLGPQALLKELPNSLTTPIQQERITVSDLSENQESTYALHVDSIIETLNRSIIAITDAVQAGQFPWIISGDHSNGLAAISAYKNLYPEKKLGVIWIDAHADIHTPYTSPSGNMHGMPLAAALGLGMPENPLNKIDKYTQAAWKQLCELGSKRISPKIQSSDLVFIDIRDLESEEIEIVQSNSIRHFTPKDRQTLGLEVIISESKNAVSHCDHILVSFDVDSMDPSISSGTGTPVHGGLSKQDAVQLLAQFLTLPNLFSFEVTEINPLLDRHNPMEISAAEVLTEAFKQAGFLG